MLTGSNLLHTKQFNLRIVHETIRLSGPLSRADVARHTSLAGQTVSNLVKELIELGLVQELERRQEGRGAPSTMLSINPDGAYSIGLDFNRDHLTGVLVDLCGNVRRRAAVELELPTPAEALELMVGMVEQLIAEQGLDRSAVCGVGIGIPGPMYHAEGGKGYLVNPKSFAGWNKIPLADWLRTRLGLPVILENNATAAAMGERWYGAGQQIDTFFYFFFGSGLGGGLVMNGRTYEGFSGNAGEVGYLPAMLAGDGGEEGSHIGVRFNLLRLYEQLRTDGIDARTPDDLDELFAAEDPRLIAWFDDVAAHLTGLVLAVEYLLDPEAIFFGGRLSDRMLKAFIARVEQELPGRRVAEKVSPRLLLATAGSDAAALGVATLPIYQLFAPAPQVLMKQGKRRNSANGFGLSFGGARA